MEILLGVIIVSCSLGIKLIGLCFLDFALKSLPGILSDDIPLMLGCSIRGLCGTGENMWLSSSFWVFLVMFWLVN